ncbi:hypothetical protein GGS20DRAFT_521537 [Poronia punctata]|nr:hypothetical protein GGS20DRAFT_521537 [Poronia punctata]
MPPRLPPQLRPRGGHKVPLAGYSRPEKLSTCLFCSLSQNFTRERAIRRPKRTPSSPRFETTIAAHHGNPDHEPRRETRKELELALLGLQKHAANHVNLSRLQLALNGLRQKPGEESIRVAIIGLTSGKPTGTAKDVLKLLLADPLKDAETWEQEIEQHDLTEPMIIRIAPEGRSEEPTISFTRGNLLREINVSSPNLNGHSIEILLADTNPFLPAAESGTIDRFEDAVLVPTVDIPTSNTGRYTPITTPVHKALVVAEGLGGVLSVMSMPTLEGSQLLKYAVDIPEYKPADSASMPFTPIDVGTANAGLELVRKNIGDAVEYEHMWFQSNLPKLVEWLKTDILTTSDGTTKPPVRELIASLLRNTTSSIRAAEAKRVKSRVSTDTNTSSEPMREALAEWAESAHSELQTQLELAFSGRRWRKLGWWKLFWRVDDVGMLTNDILTQKFLTEAERRCIFLAGRMKEAGVDLAGSPSVPPTAAPSDLGLPSTKSMLWPVSIPDARAYLQTETVPALQALAQKLVLQTLSTSGLTTALGALTYIGTLSTSLYEAGAIAALGIVWSMRRMQKQWEKARDFWEGEVREEGRKAVRNVEEAMFSAVSENNTRGRADDTADTGDDLEKASDLVTKAQKLLEELK